MSITYVTTIKGLLFVLGVFEFFAAYKFYTDPEAAVAQNALLSRLYLDDSVKPLYICYILTLGMARLSFFFSKGGAGPWAMLIGTHICESVMWWNLMQAAHLSSSDNILHPDTLIDILSGKFKGGALTVRVSTLYFQT